MNKFVGASCAALVCATLSVSPGVLAREAKAVSAAGQIGAFDRHNVTLAQFTRMPVGEGGAPQARDYRWSVEKLRNGEVSVEGAAPSQEFRAEIAQQLGADLKDTSTVTANAPAAFEAVALSGLEALKGMDSGRLSFSGGKWSITGTVTDAATKQVLLDRLVTDPAFGAWLVALAVIPPDEAETSAPPPDDTSSSATVPVPAEPTPLPQGPAALSDPNGQAQAEDGEAASAPTSANGEPEPADAPSPNTETAAEPTPDQPAASEDTPPTAENSDTTGEGTPATGADAMTPEVSATENETPAAAAEPVTVEPEAEPSTAPTEPLAPSAAADQPPTTEAAPAAEPPASPGEATEPAAPPSNTPAEPSEPPAAPSPAPAEAVPATAPPASAQPSAALAPNDACRADVAAFSERNAILFKSGSAAIAESSVPAMDELAGYLQTCPDATVHVEGHTDADGNDDANLALSVARAEAVTAGLAERGIDARRLYAIGFGETMPIASNDTAEGKRLNRRIVVSILDEHR